MPPCAQSLAWIFIFVPEPRRSSRPPLSSATMLSSPDTLIAGILLAKTGVRDAAGDVGRARRAGHRVVHDAEARGDDVELDVAAADLDVAARQRARGDLR